jgi:hypothetical protein
MAEFDSVNPKLPTKQITIEKYDSNSTGINKKRRIDIEIARITYKMFMSNKVYIYI